jgi:hypothetical protein
MQEIFAGAVASDSKRPQTVFYEGLYDSIAENLEMCAGLQQHSQHSKQVLAQREIQEIRYLQAQAQKQQDQPNNIDDVPYHRFYRSASINNNDNDKQR